MSDRPQPQPSRDQGTESSMSALNDGTLFHDPRRPENTGKRSSQASGSRKLDFNTPDLIADMDLPPGHALQDFKERIRPGPHPKEKPEDKLGGNDLVGQGLPKPSLVQQGKQKVPHKGEASTTEPSAGTSDSRDIPSKEQLDRLFDRAMATPEYKTGTFWPNEHTDFFEAYLALHTDSHTKLVNYEALQNEYKDWLTPHPLVACQNKVSYMRRKKVSRSNRWKSLCLDGT